MNIVAFFKVLLIFFLVVMFPVSSANSGKLVNILKIKFGGCYKQSEVEYDECFEAANNVAEKEIEELKKLLGNKAKGQLQKKIAELENEGRNSKNKKIKLNTRLDNEIAFIRQDLQKSLESCFRKSKTKLMKCRMAKNKLKKNKTREDLVRELNKLASKQIGCFDKRQFCASKNIRRYESVLVLVIDPNPFFEEDISEADIPAEYYSIVEQVSDQVNDDFEHCLEDMRRACDYDKAEMEILKEYISTDK